MRYPTVSEEQGPKSEYLPALYNANRRRLATSDYPEKTRFFPANQRSHPLSAARPTTAAAHCPGAASDTGFAGSYYASSTAVHRWASATGRSFPPIPGHIARIAAQRPPLHPFPAACPGNILQDASCLAISSGSSLYSHVMCTGSSAPAVAGPGTDGCARPAPVPPARCRARRRPGRRRQVSPHTAARPAIVTIVFFARHYHFLRGNPAWAHS